MRGINTMYGYKWKKAGLIVSAISLMLLIVEKIFKFIVFPKMTCAQHVDLLEWVMLVSLCCIIYCEEKYEDDRAKMVRLKSFQLSFPLLVMVMLSLGFTGALNPDMHLEPHHLFMIAAMGIILYLFLFHIGMYADGLWDYGDKDALRNAGGGEKDALSILVYLIGCGIMLVLVSLL